MTSPTTRHDFTTSKLYCPTQENNLMLTADAHYEPLAHCIINLTSLKTKLPPWMLRAPSNGAFQILSTLYAGSIERHVHAASYRCFYAPSWITFWWLSIFLDNIVCHRSSVTRLFSQSQVRTTEFDAVIVTLMEYYRVPHMTKAPAFSVILKTTCTVSLPSFSLL